MTEPTLSRRDYFAAMAMQGCLAYSEVNPNRGNWQENFSPESLASQCVIWADALIAELDRTTPKTDA